MMKKKDFAVAALALAAVMGLAPEAKADVFSVQYSTSWGYVAPAPVVYYAPARVVYRPVYYAPQYHRPYVRHKHHGHHKVVYAAPHHGKGHVRPHRGGHKR